MAFSYKALNDKTYYLHQNKKTKELSWSRAVMDHSLIGDEIDYDLILKAQEGLEIYLRDNKDKEEPFEIELTKES